MPTTFRPADNPSAFRRIASSMWRRPADPTIHGFMDVEVSRALDLIARHRRATGRHLTMTHVVAHAVARAFDANPELNARIRWGGKLEVRDSVDLVISVATGGDLSAAKLDGAETLTLDELADAVNHRVARTRNGDDENYERSRGLMKRLPWWLVRPALAATDVVSNELSLHLPGLGMPRDPFGTAVITNVGMFGIDTAFAPLLPMGRSAMLLLVTEVRDRPWVVDGRIECRPVLRLCASFDHRIIDGVHAGRVADVIRTHVENPAQNSHDNLRIAQ